MKRIVVCVFACLLLMISANAEGLPVREKIHIGDPVETVLSAEPFGIMYHRTNKDGRSGVITSNKGNIFGNSGSYVEYVIDEAADLREANFIFGTDSSFEVLQTQYDYIESELDASYGESLGGIFGSNNGVNGYTYRFYDAYKSEFSSYPDIVGFSERVVILENYNVKIEHLLLRRSSDYGVEYHHYLCYKGFLDSEAPLWAKKKNGFVYAGISNKLSNIDTSEKSEEYALSEFDYSMLDGLSVADLETLRAEIDTKIAELERETMPAENSIKIDGATYILGIPVVSTPQIDVSWKIDIEADEYMLMIYHTDDTEMKNPPYRLQTEDEFASIDLADFATGTYKLLLGARVVGANEVVWTEAVFRVENSRVENSAPSDKKNKGIWMKQHFVDEFDLPTDSAYVRLHEDIWGTFSNSAVDDRELRVSFLVTDDREIHVFLYEYGDNLVKNIFSDTMYYNTVILDSEKNKHNLQGRYPYHGDRLIFSGTGFDTITKALSLGGKVRFSIKAEDSLDSYQFTIEDATGFDVAYEDMLNSK